LNKSASAGLNDLAEVPRQQQCATQKTAINRRTRCPNGGAKIQFGGLKQVWRARINGSISDSGELTGRPRLAARPSRRARRTSSVCAVARCFSLLARVIRLSPIHIWHARFALCIVFSLYINGDGVYSRSSNVSASRTVPNAFRHSSRWCHLCCRSSSARLRFDGHVTPSFHPTQHLPAAIEITSLSSQSAQAVTPL